MNQLEKVFLLCVTCFCLFFVLPTFVHGEIIDTSSDSTNGKEDKRLPNVLFSNLQKVDNIWKDTTPSIDVVVKEAVENKEKTVKETVDFTKQTITDLSEPLESKPITSILESSENLLNKTAENSVPAIEKTMGTVTDIAAKTTSEVTNVVNDTVNSVVYELPTIPVVTPVVNEVSKTVKKTTSSVLDVVEKTGKFVNENKKSTNNILKDIDVENSDTGDSRDKIMKPPLEIIQNAEKTIIGDCNFDPNPTNYSYDVRLEPERKAFIPSLPAIGTDGLVKQDGTSNLEEHHEIEIIMDDEDNFTVDAISEEYPTDLLTVDKGFSAIEQVRNYKSDMIEKKTANKASHPWEPSQKWRTLLPDIIIVASPSTASPTFSVGGQSDSFSGAIVDVFTFISSHGRQWIHTDENATVQWTHAPPGKPPQQSPF